MTKARANQVRVRASNTRSQRPKVELSAVKRCFVNLGRRIKLAHPIGSVSNETGSDLLKMETGLSGKPQRRTSGRISHAREVKKIKREVVLAERPTRGRSKPEKGRKSVGSSLAVGGIEPVDLMFQKYSGEDAENNFSEDNLDHMSSSASEFADDDPVFELKPSRVLPRRKLATSKSKVPKSCRQDSVAEAATSKSKVPKSRWQDSVAEAATSKSKVPKSCRQESVAEAATSKWKVAKSCRRNSVAEAATSKSRVPKSRWQDSVAEAATSKSKVPKSCRQGSVAEAATSKSKVPKLCRQDSVAEAALSTDVLPNSQPTPSPSSKNTDVAQDPDPPVSPALCANPIRKPPAKEYKCSECDFVSLYADAVSRHQLAQHTASKLFECPYCCFETDSDIEMKDHTDKGSHVGGSGGRNTGDLEMLFESSPHQERLISDADFQRTSPPRQDFAVAAPPAAEVASNFLPTKPNVVIAKVFQCQGTATNSISGTPNPIQPSKEYKCPDCGFSSPYSDVIRRHQMALHSSKKLFECPNCSFDTDSVREMQDHSNRGSHFGFYACGICSMSCSSISELSHHKKIQHPDSKPEEEKPGNDRGFHVNNICAGPVDAGSKMWVAPLTKQPEPMSICSTCKKSYRTASGLARHIKKQHMEYGHGEQLGSQRVSDSRIAVLENRVEPGRAESAYDYRPDPARADFVFDNRADPGHPEPRRADCNLVCWYCLEVFGDITVLQQHFDAAHGSGVESRVWHPCQQCHGLFATRDELDFHNTMLHPSESSSSQWPPTWEGPAPPVAEFYSSTY